MTILHIGDEVINLGQRATIIGFHPITWDIILQNAEGLKWIAIPSLIEPVVKPCRHKEGLVIFE